jgi:hypothetical protein
VLSFLPAHAALFLQLGKRIFDTSRAVKRVQAHVAQLKRQRDVLATERDRLGKVWLCDVCLLFPFIVHALLVCCAAPAVACQDEGATSASCFDLRSFLSSLTVLLRPPHSKTLA